MVRKKQRRRSSRVEEDPMTGTANLVDAMLVIAVGFLVFVIISWNMQGIIFNENMTADEKQEVMSSISEVTQGAELNETPDTSNSSGQGYTEMGKVYKIQKLVS